MSLGHSRLTKALVLGGVTALAGVLLGLLPVALDLEESVGLDLLFRMRGPVPPPPDVVVLSIDKASADLLGVPPDPAKWPRGIHAQLIDYLARQGAATIVFDVVFDQLGGPEEGRILADAILRAHNVVLAEYLTRETIAVPGAAGAPPALLTVEQRVPPVPVLAEAALGLAPFPLPKVPVKVSQYWTFKTEGVETPTLPVVAFQVFALDLYDSFLRLVEQVSPDQTKSFPPNREAVITGRHVEQLARLARELIQRHPAAAAVMAEQLRSVPPPSLTVTQRRTLHALVELFRGPSSRYLNFYGPPGTITTIPYHRAVAEDSGTPNGTVTVDFRGKAVFIGLAEATQSLQKDGFYTVFSQTSGVDLSGVEIAATAFANLLAGSPVQPLGLYWHVVAILVWGLSVGVVARLLPISMAVPVVLAGGLVYLLAAKHEFDNAARWYPLVTPLFLQIPAAVLGAVVWSYVETHRERTNVRRALGYYLPPKVADQLARDIWPPKGGSTLFFGTCLSTDAHQYTALAETMTPAELGVLMNRYYAAIFEPVKRHGGIVQDVVGDSMLAIWASEREDAVLRRQACLAALDIAQAVDRFNQEASTTPLPTRIGLHSGQMLLGNVGAIDHYEYRAVGDIVNTATRLENLNKYLGTRILVSTQVLEQLDGLLARPLGRFLLVGKSRPVEVAELVCRAFDASPEHRRLCAAFAEAMAAYRGQAWKQALELFRACLRAAGDDGPARFYSRLCEQYLESPPDAAWEAVVRMEQK